MVSLADLVHRSGFGIEFRRRKNCFRCKSKKEPRIDLGLTEIPNPETLDLRKPTCRIKNPNPKREPREKGGTYLSRSRTTARVTARRRAHKNPVAGRRRAVVSGPGPDPEHGRHPRPSRRPRARWASVARRRGSRGSAAAFPSAGYRRRRSDTTRENWEEKSQMTLGF